MGLLITRLYGLYETFGEKPARIVMLGLDAAGKTTILYKIKLDEIVRTIPTVGFNVETVEPCDGISFTVWDVGGQDKIRKLWKYYYQDTEGLIFVVDSADRSRMQEARVELNGVLSTDQMRGVPVVVIANKQDMPGAMKLSDVKNCLQLRNHLGRKWHVQGACATTGEGIYEAMQELARLIKDFKKNKY